MPEKILQPCTKGLAHGATQLLMVLVLLGASTLLMLTVARTGILEQQMSVNEYRSKTLRLAAETGLEHAIAWLGYHLPDWDKTLDSQGRQTTPLPEPTPISDDSYEVDIRLRRTSPYSPYVAITSTATSASNQVISLSVHQFAAPNGGPIHPGIDLPPLVIEGCLGPSTGGAALYPRDWRDRQPTGPAIQTRTAATTGCIEPGNLRLYAGSIQYETFTGSAWDYVFRKSREEIRALAEQEAETQTPGMPGTFIMETGTNAYYRSWGTPSHPVVLIFSATAGCPRFFGGATVYGIVYIEGDCTGSNGLGGLEVYGTMVIAGDVSTIRPGTRLHHFSEVSGGPLRFVPDGIATVPGTWRDF